jgi:ribosomal protein S18 acetylase RimI-like enzyme
LNKRPAGRIIRLARPDDVPAIVSLLGRLFGQEADFKPDPDRQRRGVAMILSDPSAGRILVCESGGEIVGMASLLMTVSTAEGGPAAWLEDMIVAPDCCGDGVGRELLEAALELATVRGATRVTLLTDRDNEKAQAFYRRNGFRESAMIPMRRSIG